MREKIKKLKGNKLVKDYSVTLLFSGLNAVVSFGLFKLVFNEFGEDEFYRFSMLKRLLGFLLPLSLLGLAVSLSKSVSKDVLNKKRHSTLLMASLILGFGLPLLSLFLYLFAPSFVSQLFWSSSSTEDIKLSFSLIFYIFSLVIGTLTYSVFRGQMKFLQASILEFFNLSIFPILGFLFASDLFQFILYMSTGVFVLNILLFFILLFKHQPNLSQIKPNSSELISFGLPRLPGDFAFYFLLALPAIIGIRIYSGEVAGVISFGISLLALTQVVLQPVGVISLTRAVHLIHSEQLAQLKKETFGTLKIMLGFSFLLLIAEFLFLDIFIELFFDSNFLKHGFIFRTMILAIPSLTVFYSLRGVIDAYYHKPIVGNISLVSILFFGLCAGPIYFFELDLVYFLISFVLSLFLLSILCFFYTRKIFSQEAK